MKCLDKKRIKMKNGETLALNERIMLSLVSTGVSAHRPPTKSVLSCQQNFAVLFSVLRVCYCVVFSLECSILVFTYFLTRTSTSLSVFHCKTKAGRLALNLFLSRYD